MTDAGTRLPVRPIRRLDDALIDQIAAGEVVERPASVVKELVENAIDAGAARIRVEVRGGGQDWIAVSDDGAGMTPEDAELALERHATSKLCGVEDLARIQSYGFRGEALPAIASVSTLTLRTRARGAPEGFELRVRAGRREAAQPVGAPEGTRVEVADLFGSVPARRKFLKTAATEWGHVADWLARAALALPHIHFDRVRDDRPVQAWPAVDALRDRAAAVLGEAEVRNLVRVDHRTGRLRVHGLVSPVDTHRATTGGIRLYVNGRSVRDRLLQHALVDVYRDLLPRGRFPSALLFLDVPPEAVDVNVHPAKWEVRFVDPRGTHRLLRDAVRDAVATRRWSATPAGRAGPGVGAIAPGVAASGGAAGRPAGGARASDWLFASASGADLTRDADPPAQHELVEGEGPAAPRVRFADLRLLGPWLATYLVLETKEALLLVDQHAAHERVLYEQLRAEWLARGVERQALLAPLAVELEPRAFAALSQRLEDAERLGFEVEAFGEQTLAVRAVPALLSGLDPAALLRSLGDELAEGEGGLAGASAIRTLAPADRAFATLACHAARRKGDVLAPREQRALLDALDAIPWAPTCPHGRPVAVALPLSEIERRFARR